MATRRPLDRAAIDAVVDEWVAENRAQPPADIPRLELYIDMHPPRYKRLMRVLLGLISRLPRPSDGKLRILDVGPRFDVELIHRLMPDVLVDTIGIDPGYVNARESERRVIFDLNNADFEDQRPEMSSYPLIVMAEVLEHLYMPPSVTLSWVASLLEPGGYLLVQTPNAVSLPNRLRMLIGKNPFQPLTAERAFPGHKREYTVSELKREGRDLGLDVVYLRTGNYFASAKLTNRLYGRLERLTPRTLRAGITIVYRAPVASSTQ